MANFIFAASIHTGGGAELLKQLIRSPLASQVKFLLDERFVVANADLVSSVDWEVLSSSLVGRIRNYVRLKRQMTDEDHVLLFNGLPPLLKTKGKHTSFVQNGYLFGLVDRRHQPLTARIRLTVESFLFRTLAHRCDGFVVQREGLGRSLKAFFESKNPAAAGLPIDTVPFFDRPLNRQHKEKRFDFFYPASADHHKNHRNLLE